MSFREDLLRRAAQVFGVDLQKLSGSVQMPAQGSSGVASAISQLPAVWQSATFGPGMPIQPLPSTSESLVPREIDYPISVNASLQPRTGYGLMPFEALKQAYETITEVRMPTSTIIRELCGFVPRLVDLDGNQVEGHPYQFLTTSPDRVSPFSVWLARFLQSKQVYDAGALFIDNDGSDLHALRYIDGSTLFLIVDEHGEMPKPGASDPEVRTSDAYISKLKKWVDQHPDPDFYKAPNYKPGAMFHGALLGKSNGDGATILKTPAFAQVIKGIPFGWYSQDEIWYRPSMRRTDSPYGTSYIEMAWPWVITIANIVAFELAHYRTGNMPEGLAELPKEMFPTLERIQAYELAFNQRMSTGSAERMRQRFVPEGTKWRETKKAEFPQKLYERARDNISLLCGVPPSEYGSVPGQGLGGKGFAEAMQSALFRMGLMPNKSYVDDAINQNLRRFGVEDAVFNLDLPGVSMDPDKQKTTVKELFASGLLTMNDALAELGLDPVDNGDIHMIISGGTVIVLEDYLAGKRDAPPAGAAGDAGSGGTGSVPPNLVSAATSETAGKGNMTDQDYSLASNILESGKVPGTGSSYSIPSSLAQKRDALIAEVDALVKERDDLEKWVSPARDDHGRRVYGGGTAGDGDAVTLSNALKGGGFSAQVMGSPAAMHQVGYMLSTYIKQQKTFPPETSRHVLETAIRKFKNGNAALLKKPNHYLGGWWSDKYKAYFLDVSIWDGNLKSAMRAAKAANQDSIFDLATGQDISVGGNPLGKKMITPNRAIFIRGEDVDDPELFDRFVTELMGDNADPAGDGDGGDLGKWLPYFDDGLVALQKIELAKHCGTCPEDDEYYQAPIAREASFDFPGSNHANDVEIVAMQPDGLPAKPALWKPEGGEEDVLRERVGGAMYPREEAAYLLDRSLGLFMVPVAYTAEVSEEQGAAVFYVMGNEPADDIASYDPAWVERAAIFDYITQQLDRHAGNFFTHPDDEKRVVLIDNGMSFPTTDKYFRSAFVSAMQGKELSSGILTAIKRCLKDKATWTDIAELVGDEACNLAMARATVLTEEGVIPESAQTDMTHTGIDSSGNVIGGSESIQKIKGAGKGTVPVKDIK